MQVDFLGAVLRTLRVGGSEAASGRSAPGAPPTPAGEEYLLFLNQPSMGGAFHTLGDYYYITGVTQGVF